MPRDGDAGGRGKGGKGNGDAGGRGKGGKGKSLSKGKSKGKGPGTPVRASPLSTPSVL